MTALAQNTRSVLKASAAMQMVGMALGLWCGASVLTASFSQAQAAPQSGVQAAGQAGLVLAVTKTFAIAQQELTDAVALFGQQAGVQISAPAQVLDGVTAPAVNGVMSVEQALAALLVGTGASYRVQDGAIILFALPKGAGTTLDPVRVGAEASGGKAALGAVAPAYAGGQVARGGRIGSLGVTDMMDTPFNAVAFTAETIANQQASTVGEVLANDPAVRTSYGYGNFSEQFIIRGFPLYGDDLMVDGLYGMAPRQIAATELFERVEVLRGASAFLNGVAPGGTAIGGTINLLPKRAKDTPTADVTASYGMGSQFGGHVDLGQRFGSDKQFGVRLNAAQRQGDTAIDEEHRSLRLVGLGLDFRGQRLRTSLDLSYQRFEIEQGRPVVFLTGTRVPKAPDADSNYAPSWTYSDLQDRSVQARAEYDLTKSVMGYVALGYRDVEENGDYSSPNIGNDGTGTTRRMSVPREDVTQTGQAGLRADAVTGPLTHRVDVGFSALHTLNRNAWNMSGNQTIDLYNPSDKDRPATAFVGGDFNDLPRVSETTLKSLYGSDTLGLWDDRILVTVGARRQWLQVESYDRASQERTANYNETALSPVLGVVLKATETVSLYANRIEGLVQGPTAPSTASNSGEVFEPYLSVQYEVGGKVDMGNIGGSIALFQTTQPMGVTDPTTLAYAVSGEQRNRGVEVMMFGEPMDGVRLLGGVTYTQATLKGTAGGSNDGHDAVGVPKYQANLGAEWETPFAPELTLSARVLHTASQYVDVANSLKVPSWSRLDVGARVNTEFNGTPMVVRTNIENITNEAYWASAHGGYLTQGNPLTAKLSVGMSF